jgi:hypothetical protein
VPTSFEKSVVPPPLKEVTLEVSLLNVSTIVSLVNGTLRRSQRQWPTQYRLWGRRMPMNLV